MITTTALTRSPAVDRARRVTVAGRNLRAIRGRLRWQGLAGAELCWQPPLTALRRHWQGLASRDIDLTVLSRALEPVDDVATAGGPVTTPPGRVDRASSLVTQGISRAPGRGPASAPGPVPWRGAVPDGGPEPRSWFAPARTTSPLTGRSPQDVWGDAVSDGSVTGDLAVDPVVTASDNVGPSAPTAFGDRSGPLVRRGPRPRATDAPDAVAPSGAVVDAVVDSVGTGTLPQWLWAPTATPSEHEDASLAPDLASATPANPPTAAGDLPTRRRPAVSVGQFVPDPAPGGPDGGSPAAETGATQLVTGLTADTQQRGLSELLRRWEDAEPAGAATTFPGAAPVPGRGPAGLPGERPERAGHRWPVASSGPADLLDGHGGLEDAVEEALDTLLMREAERHGLDAGAP
jgi:hypothetical protein